MKALIVRTENEAALRKLGELLRTLNFEVEQVEEKPVSVSEPFEPDFMSLAGLWKDRDITQEELRKAAWGNRL